MEGLKQKVGILEEILEFSKRQARLLEAKEEMDADVLMSVTEEKQHAIDRLNELDKELEAVDVADSPDVSKIQKKIKDLLQKITDTDAKNIKALQTEMEGVKKEMKENKEKIKVNKAYKPVLGRETDNGQKLNVKDDRKR